MRTLLFVALLAISLAPAAAATTIAPDAPNCTGIETSHSCTGMDDECIGHHVYAFFEYCFGIER